MQDKHICGAGIFRLRFLLPASGEKFEFHGYLILRFLPAVSSQATMKNIVFR
jgi:hypothetical protein